jgi:hypothetical protein
MLDLRTTGIRNFPKETSINTKGEEKIDLTRWKTWRALVLYKTDTSLEVRDSSRVEILAVALQKI